MAKALMIMGTASDVGKSSLGGGFGLPSGQSWGVQGRPVRMTRDPKSNRPLITTDFSPPRAMKRG
jgi:hypothetical protein